MDSPQKSIAFISPEEYLALENASPDKPGYMVGVVYGWQGSNSQGMTAAPLEHNCLCLNAALVVEVLSPRTATFDRSDKFLRYLCMDSLERHVPIDPEKRSVEVYRQDQNWQKPQNPPWIQSAPSTVIVQSDFGSNKNAAHCYALGMHSLVFQAQPIFGEN